MAGYSGTPLAKKLGIKPNTSAYLLKQPDGYLDWLSPLPEGFVVRSRITGALDFIHLFVKEKHIFEKEFSRAKRSLKKDGMIWISWPKKASKVPTDLDENIIRDYGLREGLVDVKVCAVDETWSGLKFVVPLKNR